MVKIIENVLGQLEFDFDYLVSITNQKFVDFIKENESDYDYDIKLLECIGDLVVVTTVNKFALSIYHFDKNTDTYKYTWTMMSEINGLLGGQNG